MANHTSGNLTPGAEFFRLTSVSRTARRVVTQFRFANACEKTFPSSQRRGGRDINKMLRSILLRSGRGAQTGRTKYCAELTTPSARKRSLRGFLIDRAATPPLRGGEYSSQTKTSEF